MFIQVIRGRVTDDEAMSRRGDAWQEEVAPVAIGFQGSVTGRTPDGEWITVARFASAADAAANSALPEQQAWWEATAALFDGPPTFVQGDDTETTLDGPSADAGFVQVMIGAAQDRAALAAIEAEALPRLQAVHPAVLGGVRLWDGDRGIEAVYFSSEAEARQGEAAMGADPELGELMGRMQAAMGEVEFLDLPEPTVFEA